MKYSNTIIIGSGAAAMGALLGLKRSKPLILDVGFDYKGKTSLQNKNINKDQRVKNLKINSMNNKFATASNQELIKFKKTNFKGVVSYALGGLANLWGGGVYRFDNNDLKNFPINYNDLKKYYDFLSKKIFKIQGKSDCLKKFLKEENMFDNLKLQGLSNEIIQNYYCNKKKINNQNFYLGKSRIALNKKEPRKLKYASVFDNQSLVNEIFNPKKIIKNIIKKKKLSYKKNILVKSFKQIGNNIIIKTKNLKLNKIENFKCKRLILGSGTINTTQIVLSSVKAYNKNLNFLDNVTITIPIFAKNNIKNADIYKNNLCLINLVNSTKNKKVNYFGSFFGVPKISILERFIKIKKQIYSKNYLLERISKNLGLLVIFFPSKKNLISLDENNRVNINMTNNKKYKNELLKILKLIKILKLKTYKFFTNINNNGNGIHYAGTLPMKYKPKKFQCDKWGKLHGYNNVYIVDGSNLTNLPAKNLTYTIMANAMRIASNLR